MANNITQATIRNMVIVLPPIHEQALIMTTVKRERSRIQQIISTATLQIDKLHEYRQALITAAVTGKINLSRVESSTGAVP